MRTECQSALYVSSVKNRLDTLNKSQLDGFQKRLFDPFCRIGENGTRIEFFYDDDNSIATTVGQLNSFKWAIENNILVYIKDNIYIL